MYKGGHVAALEQPETLASGVLGFLCPLRNGG